MKEFRVILELDPKAGARDSSVMKSVNADIPALAHKERRIVDGELMGHRRLGRPASGRPDLDGLELGRVPAEAGAHMLFSFQRPSALSSASPGPSGRNKGLSSGEAHYRAALGGHR